MDDGDGYTKMWMFVKHVGQKLHGVGFGKEFLDMTLKAQTTKEKLDKFHQN